MLALLDRQALQDIVHHLLRQVVGNGGDLVRGQRFRCRDELLGVHRRDQRLADGVRHLDENLAVAIRLDEVPQVESFVERQRLEHVGDVGRVQPCEHALERLPVLPRHGALRELVVPGGRRVLELVVDQPFDEPVLAQQRRDFGERVLHVLPRLGAFGHRIVDAVGHGERCDKRMRRERDRRPGFYGKSAAGIRARMMRILRFSPGAPWLCS